MTQTPTPGGKSPGEKGRGNMKFVFKRERFADTGKEYTGKVTRKYINGYCVEIDGEEYFACKDDIEVLEMTEEDKKAPFPV